jgi:hypothetical protein
MIPGDPSLASGIKGHFYGVDEEAAKRSEGSLYNYHIHKRILELILYYNK